MKYYSTSGSKYTVSFREATLRGLAPDGGLYMPETIPSLPSSFIAGLHQTQKTEIGLEVMSRFIGDDIPTPILFSILDQTLDFPIPTKSLDERINVLELFHGPTMAFKDVGARFMSRCIGYFSRASDDVTNVLVATSGDTGGAVANGFLKVEGVRVVILYPAGKISDFQEKQMTTLGENIIPLKVDGTFDDCQKLVKRALKELDESLQMTSANSINIARLLPQMIYYFISFSEVQSVLPIQFSVPSGNFGNLTAGLIAKRMGLPISRFIASTNINDIIPRYLSTGTFEPKPSKETISNAMDVGNPSNFHRIRAMYNNSLKDMHNDIWSSSFTDEQTVDAIRDVYSKYQYVMDPHGAVAFLGLKEARARGLLSQAAGVFLETASPSKFRASVESAIGKHVDVVTKDPSNYASETDHSVAMKNDFETLRSFLMELN